VDHDLLSDADPKLREPDSRREFVSPSICQLSPSWAFSLEKSTPTCTICRLKILEPLAMMQLVVWPTKFVTYARPLSYLLLILSFLVALVSSLPRVYFSTALLVLEKLFLLAVWQVKSTPSSSKWWLPLLSISISVSQPAQLEKCSPLRKITNLALSSWMKSMLSVENVLVMDHQLIVRFNVLWWNFWINLMVSTT